MKRHEGPLYLMDRCSWRGAGFVERGVVLLGCVEV